MKSCNERIKKYDKKNTRLELQSQELKNWTKRIVSCEKKIIFCSSYSYSWSVRPHPPPIGRPHPLPAFKVSGAGLETAIHCENKFSIFN